jgi:3-deoxy-D-manno-octulosonic-acid transferase
MLSFFYDVILVLYALCILPRFLWQWCILGKYRETLKQRFGFTLPQVNLFPGEKLLWIHAISMGETRAIIPLFYRLRTEFPHLKIVISSTTETGHAEAKRSMPEAAAHFFLPFDFSWNIKKFMRHLRPSYLLLVESDLWYHLISEAHNQGARIFLVNGKISERSFRRFQKIPGFTKRLFQHFDLLCVQNALYRERFEKLGACNPYVTGNIKLDVSLKPMSSVERRSFQEELGISDSDRVLVLGSTHEPEEEQLLSALEPVWKAVPDLKVVIVPRHPERFSKVAALLQERNVPTLIYSKRDQKRGGEKVILIDAMGKLTTCYQIAEIAIVGGSFISTVGGHNIFEPICYGAPVLFGPHMHSQPDFLQLITKADAGAQITLEQLPKTLLDWLQHPETRSHYVAAGQTLVEEVKGSLQRTWDRLLNYFNSQ